MSSLSFDAAAARATETRLPVPRGVAIHLANDGAAAAVSAALPGWTISPLADLGGWQEAIPPAGTPLTLAGAWAAVRTVSALPGVTAAEPLLLFTDPAPLTERDAEAFARSMALTMGVDAFGLWGVPYSDDEQRRMEEIRRQHDWHLEQLRITGADGALAIWRERHGDRTPGDGVVVGHPDTGYTVHPAIDERWLKEGRSFIEGGDTPPWTAAIDDLADPGFGIPEQPGHGTATGSMIAGPHGDTGFVWGIAPGARILPLRVSRSVIHLDFTNVGKAIKHAADNGADVISMSLGGPFRSQFVRDAIAYAHERGVIVVSAAGNKLPTVIFPAAFPEVIAVAATHPLKGPWRFSGVGEAVDIAAPGEHVWVARWPTVEGVRAPKAGFGAGTSFGTACVAGLAALWVSYHGRATLESRYAGDLGCIPFAFQLLLTSTADTSPAFAGKGTYGAGIANAAELLRRDLPTREAAAEHRATLTGQSVGRASVFARLLGGLLSLAPGTTTPAEAEETLRKALLGERAPELGDELLALLAADPVAFGQLQRAREGTSLLPLLNRVLRLPAGTAPGSVADPITAELRSALGAARGAELKRLSAMHRGTLPKPGAKLAPAGEPAPAPAFRSLRVFSFDPSLATRLTTAPIFQVTVPARWERVDPGPVGEYLEVVDVDPASGCVYAPVDLDHPYLLAQAGIAPSEGNPHFHQQMVYAVAMNTIHRFELALGRPIFWSPIRPWFRDLPEEQYRYTPEAAAMNARAVAAGLAERSVSRRDRYVQRLRIYPHGLREANAYYSPSKRALLFGYFPATGDARDGVYPGGLIFTCLSHDIIAHETTHALLDGMHPYFNVPTNEDVPAFHEAFADVIALFQHFTYPEVLRHQVASTRGNLKTDNLLAQLAQELGVAIGKRGALRNALGETAKDGTFKRKQPDPAALDRTSEPHDRGSILVAAIFDAFLALYDRRVADLIRIATSGSGELPSGQLHPDLVNRLADEASETASEVLRICIRALDYVPPVDLTFGEFLRALITADYEIAPSERRETRIAFIEAFRRWGIYPRDVQTLSEESLRWRPAVRSPMADALKELLRLAEQHAVLDPGTPLEAAIVAAGITVVNRRGRDCRSQLAKAVRELQVVRVAKALQTWQPGEDRARIFEEIVLAQARLHDLFEILFDLYPDDELLPGISARRGFSIANLRPARRVGPNGEFGVEMVLEIVQEQDDEPGANPFRFRGGATLIIDMRRWDVKYVVYKRLFARRPSRSNPSGLMAPRKERQEDYLTERALSSDVSPESPIALAPKDEWAAAGDRCRNRRRANAVREPFAVLHRGEL